MTTTNDRAGQPDVAGLTPATDRLYTQAANKPTVSSAIAIAALDEWLERSRRKAETIDALRATITDLQERVRVATAAADAQLAVLDHRNVKYALDWSQVNQRLLADRDTVYAAYREHRAQEGGGANHES